MSKIKSLIEGAHRAVEMRWTVLCYDPEKDNELVESSKQFDCICAAQAHKKELAMKHPGYIIEIVAESKKAKNESIGQEIVDEVKEEIKAELKDAIGQDVDNAIGHPATEENLGAEVKDDMEAEEDELAMEEDIDDDSDSIFAPDDLDEVVGESAEDDFKTKSLGAIAIAKAAGFKVNDRASKNGLIVLDKGDKEVVIGLYDQGILDITAYDKGEDTYSNHWKIDRVGKADIERAAKAAIKSFNESAQKNEAVNATKVKQDVEKAVKDYFKNDKDALEYVYVDSKKDVHGRTVIEVRAELGYNGMTKLADHLDKVVQKHDRYAYFEQESGGIMTAVFESAQKNEAIGPEDIVTHAKQMEFKKQYVAKRKPKVNMLSFYFDGPFAVDDNTGTNISGAKLGMKCKDLEVALDKFFLEDAEGMKALKKLTKENKFIVYCDGHAKYCKTRQEAETHAKAIKAGQVKDLLGRTVKPTEPVKIEEIHESAQINESRNWKVLVELSAPDNMNNAYVEDTVEHFLDKSGLTVFDVTATRK